MADSKISALTALSAAPASGDLLVMVDVSDTTMAASGTDKKITYANLTSALVSGATTFATSSAQTFTSGINGGTAANDDLTINGTSHATKTSSYILLQPTGGNVGIATAAPGEKLEVTGNIKANGYIYVYDAAPLYRWYETDAGTDQKYTEIRQQSGVFSARFVSDNYGSAQNWLEVSRTAGTYTVAKIVYPSGLLGVGVTDPTALLHVAASTAARASVCVVAGTAPTTPVVGDIWNDGALSFYNADATTNAVVNHLRLSRDSTGTVAAGLGLGILAELESTTTSRQSAGRLTWEWATATHASRAAKGKLTAYYTSTEREAITWLANSSSVRVGINQPNPTAQLHIVNSLSTGGDDFIIESPIPDITLYQTGGSSNNKYWDIIVNSENLSMRAVNDAFTDAGNFLSVERTGITIDSVSVMGTGVGIGTVTAPQSLIHGHDGSGGFLFVNRASVGGTLVTVIPDAAGDVTEKIFFVGWCTNSAPFSADVAPTTLAVSSSTTKTDGTNTLTIAVTAGGAFTLQATGGAATWKVNLWVFWR